MADGAQGDQNIQAENNSIAIGGISVGGNVGDIRIGHTIGYTSEQVSTLITQISTTFQPKPFDGRSPYKGLDVFEEEDAELFFGREKLVEDLVVRVKESRTVFVTGPSGSGKSSLVRAGLIHALKKGKIPNSDRWLYATVKPGRDPFEAVAGAFSPALNGLNIFKINLIQANRKKPLVRSGRWSLNRSLIQQQRRSKNPPNKENGRQQADADHHPLCHLISLARHESSRSTLTRANLTEKHLPRN